MILLRPLFGLLLSLILATSSVTMAVAHGQSPMGLRMEICADSKGEVVTLTLDANGQPIAPNHPCPDCLAGLSAFALPALLTAPVAPESHSAAPFRTRSVALTGLVTPAAKARGPPSLI